MLSVDGRSPCERNLAWALPNNAKKKYMKLSKDELVNRLIEVEQYVAEN